MAVATSEKVGDALTKTVAALIKKSGLEQFLSEPRRDYHQQRGRELANADQKKSVVKWQSSR